MRRRGKEMNPVNTPLMTGLAFASMVFIGVGITVIGVAAPDAGLSVSTIGMLQSIQNAGFLVAVILFGRRGLKKGDRTWAAVPSKDAR